MRTRLRGAVERAVEIGLPMDKELDGTSLHTLRRTAGTLLAHEVSLDAAREQLGHRDPSLTYQHYVGKRHLAPDVRTTLDLLFAPHFSTAITADVEPRRRPDTSNDK